MQWTFLTYLFLASSSLLLFWLCYQLFLAKLTYFNGQRGYLLFSLCFSFLFPFLSIPNHWLSPSQLESLLTISPTINLSSILFSSLLIIYLSGVILKTLFFVDKLSVIRQLISMNPKERMGNTWLVKLSENGTAFSFFNYIFLTKSLEKLSTEEVNQIKTHEAIHSQQKHSLDILLIEMAEIFLWFLPVIYWMKHSLKDIHEFLVDEAMIQQKVEKKRYAQLLLKLANPIAINSLTTGFTNKQIGRRINMLAKSPSASYHKLKFLLMLPITLLLLLFSACFGESSMDETIINFEKHQTDSNESDIHEIVDINWEGQMPFSEEALSAAINVKKGDVWDCTAVLPGIKRIESGGSLKALYASKGFALDKVQLMRFDTKGEEMFLTIGLIMENDPILGKVYWEGNTLFHNGELREQLGLKYGQHFNQEILNSRLNYNKFGTDISSLYLNKGYAYFNIEVKQVKNGAYTDLKVKIFEGNVVKIAAVTINGNDKISTAELLSKIDIKSGDVFSRSKIIEAQRALLEMGKFDPEKIELASCYANQHNNQQLATSNQHMEELTKKEEEIMLIFWQLEKAFVKEVIAELDQDPKPPYNTISSIVRILERKGYLGFQKYGNTYQYYPLIAKTDYRKGFMKKVMKGYFDNSPASLLSFMVNEDKLTNEEITELKKIIEKM